MRSKKKRKNDTLYHILFWVIVVVLFPVSLTLWFFRKNPLNLTEQARKIVIGAFWGVIALLVGLMLLVPLFKGRNSDKQASIEASEEASRQASIAASEAESRSLAEEEAARSKMEITFYDMGQADAILITCEDHCMLIDSGDLSVALSAKVLEKNISNVDYVVVSTPQNESVGGLARALNHITVGTVFCTVNDYSSDKFTGFMAALEAQGKPLTVPKAGDTYELGSATVTFLGPVSAPQSVETSLVVKVTHQGKSFLFTGFADEEQLTEIVNAGGDISADLIKVGRHGRDNALNANLLSVIKPSYAVVSAGEGYGCPTEGTLQLLCNTDAKLFRTDLQGNITLVSSIAGIEITTEKEESIDTYQGIKKQTAEPSSEASSSAAEGTTEGTPIDPSLVFESGEATPNAVGWRYGRILGDKQLHRLNCPKLEAVSSDGKEYYDNLRSELASWGFTDCEICHSMQ